MSDTQTGSPFDVGKPFLSVPEVAARLHVTSQTVRNWIDQGTLPAIRVGRHLRYPEDEYEAWLKSLAKAEQTQAR